MDLDLNNIIKVQKLTDDQVGRPAASFLREEILHNNMQQE